MAITQKYLGNVGLPTGAGMRACEWVRLTLDGSLTSVTVVLPATANGKVIRGAVGGLISHNIAAAGVAGTTGFTAKFAAGTNLEFIDLFLICD